MIYGQSAAKLVASCNECCSQTIWQWVWALSPRLRYSRFPFKYLEREGTKVFKVIYRRHTNFAMESIEQTFNGLGDWSKKVTCTISRNGDLIHRAYLRVQLPDVTVPSGASFRWLNWIGHILIKSVELEIGQSRPK